LQSSVTTGEDNDKVRIAKDGFVRVASDAAGSLGQQVVDVAPKGVFMYHGLWYYEVRVEGCDANLPLTAEETDAPTLLMGWRRVSEENSPNNVGEYITYNHSALFHIQNGQQWVVAIENTADNHAQARLSGATRRVGEPGDVVSVLADLSAQRFAFALNGDWEHPIGILAPKTGHDASGWAPFVGVGPGVGAHVNLGTSDFLFPPKSLVPMGSRVERPQHQALSSVWSYVLSQRPDLTEWLALGESKAAADPKAPASSGAAETQQAQIRVPRPDPVPSVLTDQFAAWHDIAPPPCMRAPLVPDADHAAPAAGVDAWTGWVSGNAPGHTLVRRRFVQPLTLDEDSNLCVEAEWREWRDGLSPQELKLGIVGPHVRTGRVAVDGPSCVDVTIDLSSMVVKVGSLEVGGINVAVLRERLGLPPLAKGMEAGPSDGVASGVEDEAMGEGDAADDGGDQRSGSPSGEGAEQDVQLEPVLPRDAILRVLGAVDGFDGEGRDGQSDANPAVPPALQKGREVGDSVWGDEAAWGLAPVVEEEEEEEEEDMWGMEQDSDSESSDSDEDKGGAEEEEEEEEEIPPLAFDLPRHGVARLAIRKSADAAVSLQLSICGAIVPLAASPEVVGCSTDGDALVITTSLTVPQQAADSDTVDAAGDATTRDEEGDSTCTSASDCETLLVQGFVAALCARLTSTDCTGAAMPMFPLVAVQYQRIKSRLRVRLTGLSASVPTDD
jgi:hypothetical protein